MPAINFEAMKEITFLSPAPLHLAKTLWVEKKCFDALRYHDEEMRLTRESLCAIVSTFGSYWRYIDHCTLNLGHEPLGEPYKSDKDLRQTSKARLFEVTGWLKEDGFRLVDEFYPRTNTSGMNSHVMSKGEINFALNEGIDQTGESQITEFVRLWGEGTQHLALDVGAIMPYGSTIQPLVSAFRHAGFSFLTKVYEGVASDGQKIWQCFTDEIDRGFFFELIERRGERGRFVPGTVQGLYEDMERKQMSE